WLMQMPGWVDAATVEVLPRPAPSPNPERMLRELSELMEHLASATPLVIVIEDLHWSVPSTTDAILHLAQRAIAAKLLVIGSHRPFPHGHPMKDARRRLHARGLCDELPLGPLAAADVGGYLAQRLRAHPLDDRLVTDVHCRTGGHPLFVVTMVKHL